MLKRKMIRDIRYNKSQFITIFLMVFLGMLIYSGISSYMDGMRVGADQYYETYNFQDIWVVGSNFTKEDLLETKRIENVKDAERKLAIIGNIDNIEDSTVQINFIESNNISRFYVEEGIEFDANEEGVWIDSYFARNNNIKTGDSIKIRYAGDIFEKKIVGLVLVPDHVYDIKSEAEIFPTHTDYGFIYLSSNAFPYGIENIVYNYILVDVDNVELINETKADIENNVNHWIAVTDREADLSSQAYEGEMEEGNTYVGVFSGIFLFIAILSVITTMNRVVKKQRTEIGTLKALGFKNKKIVTLYISYGFWISLFAGISGIIIGPFTIGQFFLNMILKYYEMPELRVVVTGITYFVGFLVVIAISIVTYLSCRKELNEKATYLLKSEVNTVKLHFTPLIDESPVGRYMGAKVRKAKADLNNVVLKNANFSTKWNIRDIVRSKGRTIMGIAGITGCTALIICAFGMLNTLNDYLDWQFDELYNFEYRIHLSEDYSYENLANIVSLYGNNTSQTLNVEIKNGDKKETNTITVDDSNDLLKYTDKNRKFIKLGDDGIYITTKLAKQLKLETGDEIVWHIFGSDIWYASEIIGFNRNPQNQNITMTKKYLESIGIQYKPDNVYTNNNLSDVKDLKDINIIQNKEAIKNGMESMIQTMKTMILLIIIAAIVLGIVIIYNLGILSFIEKIYQFATLKVLGFKTKRIRKIYIRQNLWITFLSIVLGMPLGYYMTYFIFRMALSESYDMMAKVNNISYIYGIAGTLAVSLLVNNSLSRKVKTINMVESLKSNE